MRVAREVRGFVRVDAEHPESLDALHEIVLAARSVGLPVGTVLQANMRRSGRDLDRLVAAGVPLRLVKGAYDPKGDSVGDPAAVDAAYRALAERLLATKVPVALGTHDDAILAALAPRARRSRMSTCGPTSLRCAYAKVPVVSRVMATCDAHVTGNDHLGNWSDPPFTGPLDEPPGEAPEGLAG